MEALTTNIDNNGSDLFQKDIDTFTFEVKKNSGTFEGTRNK